MSGNSREVIALCFGQNALVVVQQERETGLWSCKGRVCLGPATIDKLGVLYRVSLTVVDERYRIGGAAWSVARCDRCDG